MKKFLLAIACAVLTCACGEGTIETAQEECQECTCDGCCDGMVPAVHEHPDAKPVGALEATGFYLMEFNITSNSCDEEFVADPEAWEDGGTWMVAAIQDTYVFGIGDFLLTSLDGALFTLDIELAEGESWSCLTESYHFESNLAFTELDVSGDYLKTINHVECFDFDENGEVVYVDVNCTFTWDVRGTRQ